MTAFVTLVLIAFAAWFVITVLRILTGRSNGEGAYKRLAIVVALGILVVAFGPYVVGYHRGYGDVLDAANEHCIRWVGSVWCKTV